MSELDLIKDLLGTAGSSRTGMKVLCFGESGAGKSPLLASFPRPLVAIDCGTGGIQPYLKPPIDGKPNIDRIKAGEEDVCIVVKSPDDLTRGAQFALDNQDWLKSVVIDEYNLGWETHMEFWAQKLRIPDGKQIEAGQWRSVKREWKARQFRLMQSKLHFGMSCWMRDILFDKKENPNPMAKAQLEIKNQEVAAIEKSIPYTTDLIVQLSIVRDNLNRPTPVHEVRVAKGRRPRSVKPEDLHVGKTWTFRSDREEDLWAVTVGRFEHAWKIQSSADVAEVMGMEDEIAQAETREMYEAWAETEAGALIKGMMQAEASGVITNMAEFKAYWNKSVNPIINKIKDKAAVGAVLEVKEQIKNRIVIGGK
jgi:hypothetical protein